MGGGGTRSPASPEEKKSFGSSGHCDIFGSWTKLVPVVDSISIGEGFTLTCVDGNTKCQKAGKSKRLICHQFNCDAKLRMAKAKFEWEIDELSEWIWEMNGVWVSGEANTGNCT